MKREIVLLLLVIINLYLVSGYGEPDESGHPSYHERASLVFINSARIAPAKYSELYMSGYAISSGPVAPLYAEPKLTKAAFVLSQEMALNNSLSTHSQLKSTYPCSDITSEFGALGNEDPLVTANDMIVYGGSDGVCADDAQIRPDILDKSYQAIGIGYAASSSNHYWAINFAGEMCDSYTSSVFSGSHHIYNGLTSFIAVYHSLPAVAPSTATVNVDGIDYPLQLELGEDGSGLYSFTSVSVSDCQAYFFTFGTSRYPETGYLVTYGEGPCTLSFSTDPLSPSLHSHESRIRKKKRYSPYSGPSGGSPYSPSSPKTSKSDKSGKTGKTEKTEKSEKSEKSNKSYMTWWQKFLKWFESQPYKPNNPYSPPSMMA